MFSKKKSNSTSQASIEKARKAGRSEEEKLTRHRRSKNSQQLFITEDEIRDITMKATMGAPSSIPMQTMEEESAPIEPQIEVTQEAEKAVPPQTEVTQKAEKTVPPQAKASKKVNPSVKTQEEVTEASESPQPAERKRRSRQEKRSKRKWGRRIAVLAAFCILLGAAYGAGRYYFQSHFFPNTLINGVDCSLKNKEDSFEAIAAYLNNYQLNVISEDGEESIKADQVGLVYKDNLDLQKILDQQDIKKWFLHLRSSFEFQAMQTTVDDQKLADKVASLDCITPSTPRTSENPTLTYNEETNVYDIVAGPVGNEVNVEALTQGIKEAMINGDKSLDLSCNTYYVPSQYDTSSEPVVKAKETADKYCSTIVHYKDGDKQMNITGKTYHKFIKIDKEYNVTLDEDAIKEFVSTKLSKKFCAGEVTVINSPGSGRIYVSSGSGEKAVNIISERKKLIENIKSGKEVTRKPNYVSSFLYSSNASIVKDDYVDINLSEQKVYVIIGGKKKITTDCVTGNVSAGRSSPTGIYKIAWKQTNYTMVKYNSFVYYWMPYDTDSGIGLHDATWRSSFGGNIYQYNGSHGCINLPLSKAREIYNTVYAGIPVVVHW